MRGKEASSSGFGNKKAAAFEAMPCNAMQAK